MAFNWKTYNVVIMRSLIICLTLVLKLQLFYAQSYYLDLGNNTGVNTESQLSSLNGSAIELDLKFPHPIQDSFKVFSYGFYLHNSDFNAIDNFTQKIIGQVEDSSKYYLLIIRESTERKTYDRFQVKLNIPNHGLFSCIDDNKIQDIVQIVEQRINSAFISSIPLSYASAEKNGMKLLGQIIEEISNGNCCFIKNMALEEWLKSEDFIELDLIGSFSEIIGVDEPNDSPKRQSMTGYVTDFAELSFETSNSSLNLEDEINNFIDFNNLATSYPKFFILKNENLCNGDYQFAESNLQSNLPFLGGILYLFDEPGLNDKIYLRIEGTNINDLSLSIADDENYVSPIGGSSSFQDLINTIRSAEEILISNGFEDINERIKILRGIYYGTDWSMDYNQGYGSQSRNNGFKLYLFSPGEPINPQIMFGNSLFQKLQKSPEVINGTQGIDWGHIIIGLDARLRYVSRETFVLGHEATGLEITTWIGDIGGGSGMLSYKRVSSPAKRAIDMFVNSNSDFGGWLNLEGDVGAYLVGADIESYDNTPEVQISNEGFISEAVANYLFPQPSSEGKIWFNRSKLFLQMIGGQIDQNGGLINKDYLVQSISKRIEDFAENYIINLAATNNVDNNPANDVNLYEASKYLKGSSNEMTRIFIHTLERAIRHPLEPIRAQNFDPEPSPAGKPYLKYRAFKGIDSLIQNFSKWLK